MRKSFKFLARPLALLFAAVAIVGSLAVPASASTAINVPSPTEAFYVGDFAGVLSSDTVNYLLDEAIALNDTNGAELVVVTVDFTDGHNIEAYSHALFNSWGIGDSELNNGLLLLLAIGEEDYWITPGRGIENYISAGSLRDILDTYLEPSFEIGDYDTGVKSTFDALADRIYDIYGDTGYGGNVMPEPDPYVPPQATPSQPQRSGGWGFSFVSTLAVIIVLVLVVVIIAFAMTFSRPVYRRRTIFGGPVYRRPFFGPIFRPRRPPPPPSPRPPGGSPRPPSGPTRPPSSGGFSSGGTSRGGGTGRTSSGSRSGGMSGGSRGRSSGGTRGGGGSSRGGGAGRKR